MKMNKIHHQNNISTMEDLVGGLEGMKDRRTKPLVGNCVNSPILHPYGRSFATTWNLGLQDLSSPASVTHPGCRQYARGGGVFNEI